MTRRGIPTAILGVLFIAASADCSLIASSELKTGIGQPCSADDDCQGGVCTTLTSGSKVCSRDCTVNQDCPTPSICIEKLCKLGCVGDEGCGENQICLDNTCQAGCRVDGDCAAKQVCGATFTCVAGCRGDADCSSGQICNASNKTCEEGCRKDDSECGGIEAGKICEANKCSAGCRDDTWCKTAGTICEALTCVSGCRNDDACGKGNICANLACVPGCKTTDGCPTGNYCDTSKGTPGECKAELAVSAILQDDVNIPAEDGLTASHKIGLDSATTAAYVNFGTDRYRIVDKTRTAADVAAAIDKQVADGAKVVVTTTGVANAEARKAAAKYPTTKFITTGARTNEGLTNVGAYSGVTDQLWYAAGKLAAREAQTGVKCIGMVLPTPTKQIVRETNAFARGVSTFNSSIKVVVRWVGTTQDIPSTGEPQYSYKATNYEFDSANDGKLYREELLTAQLADLGCTLIAHRTETQRVVSFVERIAPRVNAAKPAGNKDLFSLGVDVRDACRIDAKSSGDWIPSCLGAPYWNWGPMYTNLFAKMYEGTWSGEAVEYAFQTGPTGLMKFELSELSAKTGIPVTDGPLVMNDVANAGWETVFKGPYDFNGQRDLDGNGTPDANEQSVFYDMPLDEAELERMCWFVKGVYELPNYQQVTLASLIPAMVPYGPVVQNQIVTVDNSTDSKTKYGDVYSYITTTLSQNPAQVMSCPLN